MSYIRATLKGFQWSCRLTNKNTQFYSLFWTMGTISLQKKYLTKPEKRHANTTVV